MTPVPRVVLTTDCDSLTSLSSQDASHKTGLEITALHVNHDRTHAILAGRDILKTLRIDGTKCAEETNLRAAIINYASHHSATGAHTPTRHRDTLEIHDVKWSHGNYSSHIATAATNGKVVLYDLNRTGVELAQLHEHHRQVHKLAFNPHQGYLLLSASRDATVRLWDLRDMKKDIMSCPSRDKYSGLSEGIRDVKWSPTDGVEFAFGTENGVIQRWDYRMNRAPKLKINAHDKTCYAIDWHPDGKHLASASADKSVRIWDFSSEIRRQKPAWVIRTPFPVFNASWRPPFWSAESNEQGVWQCTHLATSYDRDHPLVHVWDFRRPSLPFREISLYNTAPTDLLWRSRDLLWTVGREGVFTQSDVHFAPKIVDRRNMSAFAVSSSGELSAFSQKRYSRRTSGVEYGSNGTYTTGGRGKMGASEKNSLPRSSADDSIDDSFLSSSFKRHHGRTASNRSTKSISSTPPTSDHAAKMMFLSDSLANQKHSFTPNQVALRGGVPGSLNTALFTFLAQKYKWMALDDPPTVQSFQELQRAFDANAEYAQKAGNHRLANSWKVVGQTVSDAVQRRALANRKRRLEQNPASPTKPLQLAEKNMLMEKREKDHEQLGLPNPAVRAIHGADGHESAHMPDSTSNVATPIARPINQAQAPVHVGHAPLPDPDHDEALALPPAAVGAQSHANNKALPLADPGPRARRPTISSQSWHYSASDLEDRRAMVSSYRAPPRIPLSLEPFDGSGIAATRPNFDRHNSQESFAMFSASTDSHGLSVPGSFASGRSPSHAQNAESLQEGWEVGGSVPDVSSFGGPGRPPGANMGSLGGTAADLHKGGPPRINFDDSMPDAGIANEHTNRSGLIPQPPVAISDIDNFGSSSEQSRAAHDIETLRRHNLLLRNSSSESDAYSSTHASTQNSFSELSLSDATNLSNLDMMEASGTIVPDRPSAVASPRHPPPISLPHEAFSAPGYIETSEIDNENLIVSDYVLKHEDVDSETDTPIVLIDMLRWLMDYHTRVLSDAQTVANIVLLTTEFLPHTHPLPQPLTTSVLNAYADHMATINMTPPQIRAILNSHLIPLTRTGINPFQVESVLLAYHNQLLSLGLFNTAAFLRRVSYPSYPAVYEQALQETQIGFRCTKCKNPINNPADKMVCENCKGRQAPCPICWSVYPPPEMAPTLKKRKSKSRVRGHQRGAAEQGQGSISIPRSATLRSGNRVNAHSHTPSDVSVSALQAGPSTVEVTIPHAAEPRLRPRGRSAAGHPAIDEPPAHPTLYTSCPICGHCAHTTCLRAWHGDTGQNGGVCPAEGCTCDCVAGPRRDERLEQLRRAKAEREKGRVRDDGRRVGESRAVAEASARARARIGLGGVGGVGGAGGGRASGGGAFGAGRERGRERAETVHEGVVVGRGVGRDEGPGAGAGGRRVRLVEPGRST
ncbi:uncharacterized protein K452DRAFT_311695 [Aplosporella prunicola CBS 121167]|uniref:Uncharacterized protein n=1 Tax=Aplosporella prunicola CBS 121167 TaxID=1176127 RepID=A0A6A6B2B4_9PEZI|nr:uncharacterized protein K452DRAFT_311695 [Aplosporella prunicola CBS 121167]KAF2138342.1 hypothetical protein K452DRAFT_311695 [Aplosporella prunicola CBS 121167]